MGNRRQFDHKLLSTTIAQSQKPLSVFSPPPAPGYLVGEASPAQLPPHLSHDFGQIAVISDHVQEMSTLPTIQRQATSPSQPDGQFQLTPPSLLQQPNPMSNYRLGGDMQLQLDADVETTMHQYIRQIFDPAQLQAMLAQLNLGIVIPPTPTAIGTGAQIPPTPTGMGGQASPTAGGPTAVSTFRLDEQPKPPRFGTLGDLVDALEMQRELHKAWEQVSTLMQSQLSAAWRQEPGAVVSAIAVAGLEVGALAALSPDARQFIFDQLNGKVLQMPNLERIRLPGFLEGLRLPNLEWLWVEVNISPPNLMVGFHADIGRLLPPILGFSPHKPIPIGGPPEPESFVPAQRSLQISTDNHLASSPESLAVRIRSASGGGAPIAPRAQQLLEQSLGASLNEIRIHTDSEADSLAQSLNAVAFTTDQDIFFRTGAYNPLSQDGFRLLAHEATHTVQQARGPVAGIPTPGGVLLSDPSDSFERAAERIADQMISVTEDAPWMQGTKGLSPNTMPTAPVILPLTPRPSPAVAPALSATLAVQRKGGGAPTPGADSSGVGISGGESTTASDQSGLAPGYLRRADDNYDTPYDRVVGKDQALAESRVILSEGIYLGAYLARYNTLASYSLAQADLDNLSRDAGFMRQFKTGDVVLRMMQAEDSEGLARVTDSHYSHSGIIQVNSGRVWVLDSYPGRGSDSTQLVSFEEFFSDHGTERIMHGLVLRIEGMSEAVRNNINSLIEHYKAAQTSFDYSFKIDNDRYVLYCSELVWRILSEAGAPVLPANEFQFTKDTVASLIAQLEMVLPIQANQGLDTGASQRQLDMLRVMQAQFSVEPNQELYSPGSLERTAGLASVAGFTREGNIEGTFKIIVVSAVIPNDDWDTPDTFIKYDGGLLGGSGETSIRDDTTTPTWEEEIFTTDYENLRTITFKLYDYDPISVNDLLTTFTGDLRPVKPVEQTFELRSDGATLKVRVEGNDEGTVIGAFSPQAPRTVGSP